MSPASSLPTRWLIGLSIGALLIGTVLPRFTGGTLLPGMSGFFTGLGIGLGVVAATMFMRRRGERKVDQTLGR